MEAEKYNNPYTVALVYDKVASRTQDDLLATLKRKATEEDDIIYTKFCYNNNPEKDNRYICCFKKDFCDAIVKDTEFFAQNGIVVKKYFVNQDKKLNNGMTYCFYIKTGDVSEEKVIDLFKFFEIKGFLKSGSYQILYPKPYSDGRSREYLAVAFNKLNGSYPKSYIKKLKALINIRAFFLHADIIS